MSFDSSGVVVQVAEGVDAEVFNAGLPVDFSRRAWLAEKMDQSCSYEELQACLRDIARVNRWTLAHRPTLQWLDRVADAAAGEAQPLHIVDVGCGYGDMLRRVEAWAKRRGVAVRLTGVDLNPDAIRAAREATASRQAIEWVVGDALRDAVEEEMDVVISTLLTHHLQDEEIVRFLEWMETRALRGWFVNDLHRKPVPHRLFGAVAPLLGLHEFVQYDGPVSIRRSFVREDWERLCAEAGVSGALVTEHRPARLCVGRIRECGA